MKQKSLYNVNPANFLKLDLHYEFEKLHTSSRALLAEGRRVEEVRKEGRKERQKMERGRKDRKEGRKE